MIARILTENGYYDSVVFACYTKGWKSAIVAFDRNFENLQWIKIWRLEISGKRSVFIYNAEKSGDWVAQKRIEGYDWVLKNVSKRFFKTVINQSILERCKELQSAVTDFEWIEIKDQDGIAGLMECTFNFHDAYVKDMYIESDKHYILFDTTWGCEILFELDGNVETNLFQNYGSFVNENGEYLQIFDSSMFFKDGSIYWTNEEFAKSRSKVEERGLYYFRANRVKWKLILPQ